jgi:hypothetical protein
MNKNSLKIVVYEPFVHFIPTGRGWTTGFNNLGHQSFELSLFQYDILQLDEPIDLLVLFGPEEKHANSIRQYKKQNPTTKIVVVCFTYQPYYSLFEDSVDLWVDHSFEHTLARQQFVDRGLRFKNVPLAADPILFPPLLYYNRHDVSFVGQLGHGNRGEEKFLFPVVEKYPNSIFGGFSYKNKTFPTFTHDKMNDIYHACKVNLNFHYPNQRREDPTDINYRKDFNGRVFEIAASGNFQIVDVNHVNEIQFDNSIVVADESNWMDVIEHYLKNESERYALAKKSQEICLKYHTWECRMQSVIDELKL